MKKERIYWLIIGVLIFIILLLYLRLSKPNEIGRYQSTDLGFLDTKEGIFCVPGSSGWVIWDLKKIRPKNKQIQTVINEKGDVVIPQIQTQTGDWFEKVKTQPKIGQKKEYWLKDVQDTTK